MTTLWNEKLCLAIAFHSRFYKLGPIGIGNIHTVPPKLQILLAHSFCLVSPGNFHSVVSGNICILKAPSINFCPVDLQLSLTGRNVNLEELLLLGDELIPVKSQPNPPKETTASFQ